MTKKHFEQMARIVDSIRKGQWVDDCGQPWEYPAREAKLVADAFIVLSKVYNPRFDTQRFLKACGLV